jgi:hypothetical protein
MPDRLAGRQDQQVLAGYEGVRRAGHGLDGHRLAPEVWPERVGGEHLQPPVSLAGPQAHPRSRAAVGGQVSPGTAVAVTVQPGQRVIKLDGADRARPAEIIRAALDRGRGPGRDAAAVDGQPQRRGQPQLAVIHQRRPGRQVGVRAGAVGRRAAAAVGRGDGHTQPGVGFQPVLGVDLDGERVALLAVRDAAEQDGIGIVPQQRPRHPAGQAVDRGSLGGFGQG